jgi:hypothetical protein
MKPENKYLISVIVAIIVVTAWGLSNNKAKQEGEASPSVSKCDSVMLANDSLSRRLEVANRRLQQYKIGLWFLRDKDKKAYDYVINAGNLNFQNEWQ